MKRLHPAPLLALVFISVFSLPSYAQLSVSKLFNDGVVLQQDVAIPIWGKGTLGDTILISFDAVTDTAVVDAKGEWEGAINSHSAGGPYEIAISSPSNQLDVSNVYFGDVWLAAGQSNMEWTLSNSLNGSTEISAANDALLRECKIQKGLSDDPLDQLPSTAWNTAATAQVGSFSAVAYYFAKELRTTTGDPIGIVNNTYGGSRIEAWMSEEMLGYDEAIELQGGTYPERQPTVIWNHMMNPILKFPFKGIIWYQGESNADHLWDAKAYGELFQTMINSWRQEMGQGDLPFLWVQLPNSGPTSSETSPMSWDAWPQLRLGQTRALSLPNTGEVVALDLGEVDIHPTDKKPVGERLATVARNLVYGENIAYSGPRYKSHTTSGDTVVIDFDFIEGGLVGDANDSLSWFSIAGSNNILQPAKAIISGNQVKVWRAGISPETVRYAWEQHPTNIDFYNSAYLPATPFYLYVNASGFSHTEDLADQTIERGERVDFNWTVFGASSVTLNGDPVDSISAVSLFPLDTMTFTFEAINASNSGDVYSKTVTINVIDPQPTISLSNDVGGAVSPNTTVTFTATAEAPGGGTVTQVEFFVDGSLVSTVTDVPYILEWTPTANATYNITAVVTDMRGNSTTSAAFEMVVSNLDVLTLEAEDATITGDGFVKNSAQANGGQYTEVQADWHIAFTPFTSSQAATFKMTIRYQLTFESPKAQKMYVNGVPQGEVMFTAPDASTWSTLTVDVPLVAGSNTISFDESWGWMSFDYISFSADPGVLISVEDEVWNNLIVYPNPIQNEFTIDLGNEGLDQAKASVLDASGRTLLEAQSIADKAQINAQDLDNGIYFIKIESLTSSTLKKVVVVK